MDYRGVCGGENRRSRKGGEYGVNGKRIPAGKKKKNNFLE
jgi:hypothetical protein